MTEIRVMAGNGCLGSGFKLESLRRGVELKPHVIACDAGSTDSGPAALGSGAPKLSRDPCTISMGARIAGKCRVRSLSGWPGGCSG